MTNCSSMKHLIHIFCLICVFQTICWTFSRLGVGFEANLTFWQNGGINTFPRDLHWERDVWKSVDNYYIYILFFLHAELSNFHNSDWGAASNAVSTSLSLCSATLTVSLLWDHIWLTDSREVLILTWKQFDVFPKTMSLMQCSMIHWPGLHCSCLLFNLKLFWPVCPFNKIEYYYAK